MTKTKNIKRIAVAAVSIVMACMVSASAAACTDASNGNSSESSLKQGTYRTYTSVMPSNWCQLTYSDNNDTQIMDYMYSSFFEYDYEFDEDLGGKYNSDGTVNSDAIVSGGYTVNYSAATALEDVTSTVDSKWGYTDAQKSEGGYAWKITLREDLTWDDGTAIDAYDFVYTMQEVLNPLFYNLRASVYYNDLGIKNAKNYLYQNETESYETPSSQGYESVAAAQADGKAVYLNAWEFWGAEGYVDENGNECPEYIDITDTTVYDTADAWASGTEVDAFSAAEIWAYYGSYLEVGGAYESYLSVVVQLTPVTDFADVGFYAESQYEIVICMNNSIQMLKDDGSLSYLAAYEFNTLPLVKEDLYEDCKVAPADGSTLWTTTYGTNRATSASWGPYKLTQFQSGKSYTLSRNDEWYGYDLEMYQNQYNVTAIECEQISDTSTQWMSFLSGSIDSIGLDVDHADDYRNSVYTYYTPGTGTFGIQLYSNLEVLNQNGRNNSILAIKDFRKAISLYIDRDDYNSTLYTAHRSCYGIIGPSYYYDVENGGVYRDTQYAKEALLRVYGFTENADGTWTDGTWTYDDYEEAYEAMNGYNPTLAKQLVESAYTELTTNASTYNYDSSKKITLVFGTSTDSTSTRRAYNYIVELITSLVEGTSLEGQIEITFDASSGSSWASAFRSGSYDIATGTGFTGGAFDPAGFLQCYVDPDAGLMYSTWWDTYSETITYTMPDGDYAEAGQTLTMSVYNWYCCLNGIADKSTDTNVTYEYNWGSGAVDDEVRLQLIAMIEEYTLEQYYTIITTSQYSATVTGAKFSYITDEYNLFMGYGDVRYMVVNYTDSEWTAYVSSQGGDLTSEYQRES